MDDWRFACEHAVKRAKKRDLGALAAREGILGLPLTVISCKPAQRVYEAASAARTARQAWLLRRRQKALEPGHTGFKDIDKSFAEVDAPQPV